MQWCSQCGARPAYHWPTGKCHLCVGMTREEAIRGSPAKPRRNRTRRFNPYTGPDLAEVEKAAKAYASLPDGNYRAVDLKPMCPKGYRTALSLAGFEQIGSRRRWKERRESAWVDVDHVQTANVWRKGKR